MNEPNLNIYKASAGSGKTYTLAKEYILLLFEPIIRANAIRMPNKYQQFRNLHREILAVTFTNKATAEMKERIVRELNKLATHQPSDYRNIICQKALLNTDESLLVDQWCKLFLDDILDDYGTFAITTIDSFFQKIVRQFARELNLPGGYAVDMDEKQIRTLAVDNMLYDIDRHQTLKEWLQDMISDSLDEGKNWDFQTLILNNAGILFNEQFRQLLLKDEVREMLKKPIDAKKILFRISKSQDAELDAIHSRLINLLADYGLTTDDLNSHINFEKLHTWKEIDKKNRTYPQIIQGLVNKCFRASAIKKGRAKEAFDNGVQQCFIDTYKLLKKCATARQALACFFVIGIIGTLDKQIEADNRENNRLPLADTNRLLNQIIDGKDLPFIYDKIAQRINHYLIDEFQDTSRLQWNNFMPLVRESLDNGYDNLIVGDVKQSIYRWRNGDADLLAYQVEKDIPNQYINEKSLDTNFRSSAQIIDWNNDFFQYLIDCIDGKAKSNINNEINNEINDQEDQEDSQIEFINSDIIDANMLYKGEEGKFKQEIEKYYDRSIHQKVNEKNNYSGLVRLSILHPTDEQDYDDLIEKHLIDLLDQLTKQRAIRPNRIAIMVRRNHEGNKAAGMLTRHGYNVVSVDSLTLSSAVCVQLIINIFEHHERPKENIYIYNAYHFFATILQHDTKWSFEQTRQYIDLLNQDDPTLISETLLGQAIAIIRAESTLYEKTESLINWLTTQIDIHHTTAQETAYLQALLDSIHQFGASQSTDMHAFLQWWDIKGNELSIPAPEQDNAVQIITIHKAKGLEFDVAIMPYCDMKFVNDRSDILWIDPKEAKMSPEFCSLPLMPIKFTKKLLYTEAAQPYLTEYKQRFLDTLNTIYVAFTRPRHELYLFSEIKKAAQANIGSFLVQYATRHRQLENRSEEEEIDIYEISDIINREDWRKKEEKESKTQSIDIPNILQSTNLKNRLKIQEISTEETKRGNLLHNIMSLVQYADDLQPAILKTCTGANKILVPKISQQLNHLINLPHIKPWFENTHLVLNELSLLCNDGKTYRPDRIMLYPDGTIIVVDYKFTTHRSADYNKQVQRYIERLREAMPTFDYNSKTITTQHIEGYLLYADAGQIEKIA